MTTGIAMNDAPDTQREIATLIEQAQSIHSRLIDNNGKLCQARDRILGTVPCEVTGGDKSPPINGEMEQLRETFATIFRELNTLEDLANAFEGL